MRPLTLCTLFMTLLTLTGTAQEQALLRVRTNSDTVLLGNSLMVSFELDHAWAQKFQAPLFEQFDIISGPNFSSSFSMINGKVSQQASYTFYLRPRDAGIFYIEPASVYINDDTVMETEPVEIIVMPNPEGIIREPEPLNEFRFKLEELPPSGEEQPGEQKKSSKKKRKTYKI